MPLFFDAIFSTVFFSLRGGIFSRHPLRRVGFCPNLTLFPICNGQAAIECGKKVVRSGILRLTSRVRHVLAETVLFSSMYTSVACNVCSRNEKFLASVLPKENINCIFGLLLMLIPYTVKSDPPTLVSP